MFRYRDVIQLSSGPAIPGATVTITNYPSGTAAALFSDNGVTPLFSNVLTADATGEVTFYAANGRYSVSVTTSYGNETLLDAIQLYDPADAGGGPGTVTSVTLTQPAAGLTLTNSGVSQTPAATSVFALANDLAGLEGLSGTGYARRTGADTWILDTPSGGSGTVTSVTLTQPAAGLTLTNSGVAQTPVATSTLSLANDLAAVEGLSATGLVRRTGADAWSAGTLVSTAEITDAAVTLAKQANLATKHYIGRTSSGTGVPEAVPAATTMRQDLGEKTTVLTDGATVSVDAALGNNFRLVLGGNRTLANPTNLIDGQVLNFRLKQDGTGSRTLAYGSKYKFPSGTAPVLTTTASATDFLCCQYDATDDTLVCVVNKAFS